MNDTRPKILKTCNTVYGWVEVWVGGWHGRIKRDLIFHLSFSVDKTRTDTETVVYVLPVIVTVSVHSSEECHTSISVPWLCSFQGFPCHRSSTGPRWPHRRTETPSSLLGTQDVHVIVERHQGLETQGVRRGKNEEVKIKTLTEGTHMKRETNFIGLTKDKGLFCNRPCLCHWVN